MKRDLNQWARRAVCLALTSLLSTSAIGAEKAPVKLKRGSTPAPAVRAQNSDEDLFDEKLGSNVKPTGGKEEACAPSAAPCDLPPAQAMPWNAGNGMNQQQQAANQNFGEPDLGMVAGLTGRDRIPAMMGDVFGPASFTATIPGLAIDLPQAGLTNAPTGPIIPLNQNNPATFHLQSFLPDPNAPDRQFGNNPVLLPPIDYTTRGTAGQLVGTPLVPGQAVYLNPLTDLAYLAKVKEFVLNPAAGPLQQNLQGKDFVVVSRNPEATAQFLADFENNQFFVQERFAAIPIEAIQVPAGALAGQVKLAENSSPLPRDRFFLNYNMFANVPLTANGVTVNRFSPGFEKTFLDGLMSIELRVPFATTLDSNIISDPANDGGLSGLTSTRSSQFGNVMATWKTYLYSNDVFAFTGGLGMAMPTAQSVAVSLPNGTQFLQVQNDSVHLMPFLGTTLTPNDRFFAQSIVQLDAPANGQEVRVNVDPNQIFGPSSLQRAGVYTEATLLYLDFATGYWVYNNFDYDARVTGVAATFEVHGNFGMNDSDSIPVPIGFGTFGTTPANTLTTLQIGTRDRFAQVNALMGTTIEFKQNSSLQLGYAFPVGGDETFDGELRCNYSYRFGAGAATRPQRIR